MGFGADSFSFIVDLKFPHMLLVVAGNALVLSEVNVGMGFIPEAVSGVLGFFVIFGQYS